MTVLFKNTKMLETQIDEFFDAISESAAVFIQGVKNYLDGRIEEFEERREAIKRLEKKADDLRRKIENYLYSYSLIPEHRGDVLGLLENMDDVIDTAKNTINQFSVECPEIPPELNAEYLELTEMAVKATESLVLAARAFFRDVKAVKDHLHKVYFYEKEADRIGDKLKRRIFKMDIDLCKKFHLRYFALNVDYLSDRAETVADRLAIYAIKRTV